MITERLLNALTAIGFTKNEAKVYAELLNETRISGYTVAKKAGITRARTYDALDQLVNKNIIRRIPGSPVLYEPREMEEIVEEENELEAQRLKAAEAELSAIQMRRPVQDSLVCITGYNLIMQSVRSAIQGATGIISIFVHQNEYDLLRPELRAAADRGVTIHAVLSGESKGDIVCDFASDVAYVDRKSIQFQMGNRWLLLTVDENAGVIGLVSHGEQSVAVSTRNRAAVSFILLNISTYFVQRDILQYDEKYQFIYPEASKYEKFRMELAESDK